MLLSKKENSSRLASSWSKPWGLKRYTYNMSRDLFRVHSENTSPAGIKKKTFLSGDIKHQNIVYPLFVRILFIWAPLGFHYSWDSQFFSISWGWKGFFLLMGMFEAGRALIYSLLFFFKTPWCEKKIQTVVYAWCWQDVDNIRRAPSVRFKGRGGGGGGFDWSND